MMGHSVKTLKLSRDLGMGFGAAVEGSLPGPVDGACKNHISFLYYRKALLMNE